MGDTLQRSPLDSCVRNPLDSLNAGEGFKGPLVVVWKILRVSKPSWGIAGWRVRMDVSPTDDELLARFTQSENHYFDNDFNPYTSYDTIDGYFVPAKSGGVEGLDKDVFRWEPGGWDSPPVSNTFRKFRNDLEVTATEELSGPVDHAAQYARAKAALDALSFGDIGWPNPAVGIESFETANFHEYYPVVGGGLVSNWPVANAWGSLGFPGGPPWALDGASYIGGNGGGQLWAPILDPANRCGWSWNQDGNDIFFCIRAQFHTLNRAANYWIGKAQLGFFGYVQKVEWVSDGVASPLVDIALPYPSETPFPTFSGRRIISVVYFIVFDLTPAQWEAVTGYTLT